MRKLKKGRILLVMGFSLLCWISKQYLRVFKGTDFKDQLEIHLNSGAIFCFMYIDYITTPKQLFGEKAGPQYVVAGLFSLASRYIAET